LNNQLSDAITVLEDTIDEQKNKFELQQKEQQQKGLHQSSSDLASSDPKFVSPS